MKLGIILLLALILRLLAFVNYSQNPIFSIQQDNYVNYASALKTGTLTSPEFSPVDTRLFPGYPVTIVLLSFLTNSETTAAILISIITSLLSIALVYKITHHYLAAIIFSFFPPVWLIQSIKIATEPLTVFLLLLSLFFFLKNRYFACGLVLGLATNVRLISVCLLFPLLFYPLPGLRSLIRVRDWYGNLNKKLAFGFISSFILLFLYNLLIFGPAGIFKQFITNPQVGGVGGINLGVFQIITDIFRTYNWGQTRILLSGLFYLILNFTFLFLLYKKRLEKPLFLISFYWMLLSLAFIFSLSPVPLLEEFGRFTVPFNPVIIFAIIPLLVNNETKNNNNYRQRDRSVKNLSRAKRK